MYKILTELVDRIWDKTEGVEKLSKKHKREAKRKLLRREYTKRSIRHFGNFSPLKPFRY